jgi:hypothetical protein
MYKIDVNVSSKRKYQDVVLIIDRPQFFIELWRIRKDFILYSKTTIADEYFSREFHNLHQEVDDLLKKDNLPSTLHNVLYAAIVNGKISNKDVEEYKPKKSHPRSKELIDIYTAHPILGRMLYPNLEQERGAYWLRYQHKSWNTISKELSTGNKISVSTIRSMVDRYKEKISS